MKQPGSVVYASASCIHFRFCGGHAHSLCSVGLFRATTLQSRRNNHFRRLSVYGYNKSCLRGFYYTLKINLDSKSTSILLPSNNIIQNDACSLCMLLVFLCKNYLRRNRMRYKKRITVITSFFNFRR